VELPDEADLAIAKFGGSVLRKRTQLQMREVYVTRRSSIKGANYVQQCTFASTRFAHNREHFAFSHLKR
jgi:hypothetical protein